MKLDTARCRRFHWRNRRATLNRDEGVGAIALAQSNRTDCRSIGGFPNSGGKSPVPITSLSPFLGDGIALRKGIVF
ncbi:hypothetical protein D3C76_317860 [compost metagenome]|jgi:hypothetical protein